MFALLFLFIALACAYPNRGPCTGNCFAHDPGMIQRASDGKYFRFSTGNGISIMTSNSLRGPWEADGVVLPDGTKIHLDGVDNKKDLWAPDVHYQDDTYYMYYVTSQIGTRNSQIGVATSKTMEKGSWTDHGAVGIPANDAYNRIDPNWITINGKQYLNFGSFWNDLYQVEMESPLKIGSATPHQIAFNETLNHREEAAFMFQHGDFYYLTYSSGLAGGYTADYPATGAEYEIKVCRSKTGTGEFVDKEGTSCQKSGGSNLLSSHGQVYAPGGQGVIQDQHLGPVLYYHYYPLNKKNENKQPDTSGYAYGWNELAWENGWPVVK